MLEARDGTQGEGPGLELLRRGLDQLHEGSPDAAIEHFGRAVRELKLAGDQRNECHALRLLAALHNELGDFAAAAQYHAAGLEIARRLPRGQHLEAEHLDGLGIAQSNRGQWQEALERFDQALAVAGRVPTVAMRQFRAHILQHRANVDLRYRRDYAAAVDAYDEALRISRELHDRSNIAFCLTFKGLCREAQGDAEEGVHLHEEARQIAEEMGDPSIQAMVYAHLAAAYVHLGQRPLAFHYGRRARELDERGGNKQGLVRDLILLGSLLCREGDDDQGLREYEKAFLMARAIQDLQNTLLLTQAIGEIYRRQNRTGGRTFYEQALALCRELGGDRRIEIDLQMHLVDWLEPMPARKRLAELLTEAREAELPDLEQRITTALGDLARQGGDLEEAKSRYQLSVERLEEMRASFRSEEFLRAFSASHTDVYQRLIQVCATTGDDAGAFEYAERSRARVLATLLASRSTSRHPLFAPAEERRYRAVCQRVLDLDLEMERAQRWEEPPAEELVAALRQALLDESEMVLAARRSAPPADRLSPAPVVTLGDLQERLRGLEKDILVLVYLMTEEEAWLFAVDRSSSELLPLSLSSRELRRRVLAFRRSLGVQEVTARHPAESESLPPPPRDPAAEQELFAHLIGPVLDRLDRAGHLCIVPHGSLHYLPFHALHDGERYLIERLPVSYAPSATLLSLSLGKPLGRVERVLALGDPTSHLQKLAWAEREVEKIAGALGDRCRKETRDAAQRRILLGPEAAGFDTWHLATHAVFVQSAPHLSYFQLATTDGDDGRVFAFELAGLEKAPRLVVASACQTALTRETPGDEVNGLLCSLLAAGCPTVVGSLWQVDDQPTHSLMIRLHRQMQEGGGDFDLAVALQQVQIQFLNDRDSPTASPFFWAPFIVQGTWATQRPASALPSPTAAGGTLVVGPGRQVALLVARGKAQLQRAARLWEGPTMMRAFEALEGAAESFSSALEIDAENLGAWRGRGLAFLGLDEIDRAAADLSRAVQLAPDDPLANAGLALSWGDDPEHLEDALVCLEHAFHVAPRLQMLCPPRNTGWLRTVLRTLRAQRVVAETSRALTLTPNDPALWAARGDGYLHLSWNHDTERHRSLAQADYEAALRLDPRHALARVRLTWMEYSNYQKGAVEAYARLADEHPDCAEAHLRLANAQQVAGQSAAALAEYAAALQLDPTLSEGWSGLGEARLDSGDLAGATAAFEQAVACDPNNPDAHLYLKEIYGALGRHEAVATESQECLRTTEHPLYQGRLGVNLRDDIIQWIHSLPARGRPLASPTDQTHLERMFEEARKLVDDDQIRGAISVYTHLLTLDPDNARALAYRGGAHGQISEHDQAFADLERATTLDPSLAIAWFNLYVLYSDRWQTDQAKAALDRALLLDPALREGLGKNPRRPTGPLAVPLEEALDEAYRTSGLQCAFCERPLRKPTGGLMSVPGNLIDEILSGVPYHCPACGAVSCFKCCAVSALSKVLCRKCGQEMKVWGLRDQESGPAT